MHPLEDADLEALRQAKAALENPALSIRLASLVGRPFDRMLARLPRPPHQLIAGAAQTAVERCFELALRTLDSGTGAAAPRNGIHRLAVGVTGAAGGAFGLTALAIELPVTTTLMFRSICDVARGAGEDLDDPDVRLQCLAVLALGGPAASDDDADAGYLAVRAALAELISGAAAELAARGAGVPGSSMLVGLVQRIAQRFSVHVGHQAAAKAVPLLGAVLGASVNAIFIAHFQRMAEAHFAIRRLERKYGREAVEGSYRAL